jgi:hypothetical protein
MADKRRELLWITEEGKQVAFFAMNRAVAKA